MRISAAIAVVGLLLLSPEAWAGDRHAGYYYPEVSSSEVYHSRAKVLEQADRKMRLDFIVGMAAAQAALPYPSAYAIFAKGDRAEKAIIIGLDGESFRTVYRARAMLAQLTARARATELFRSLAVDDVFTFFDLLHMLGFERLTFSDGETYAHQVDLD